MLTTCAKVHSQRRPWRAVTAFLFLPRYEIVHTGGPAMLLFLLKSKIHRAQVTAANVNYEGSMTIDRDFMDNVGLLPHERILCSNVANAARFATYAIPAERASGAIILNGGQRIWA